MSGLFGDKNSADGGDLAPKKHRPYRYLVTEGWTHIWTHCPICMSKNNGKISGQPRYTGGLVDILVPRSPGSNETIRIRAVACTCLDGERYRESRKIKSILDYRVIEFSKPVAIILWDVEAMGRKPRPEDLPEEPDQERAAEYGRRVAAQSSRFLSGEIDSVEFDQNERALRDIYVPQPYKKEDAR